MVESFGLLLAYPGNVIKRYLARERFTRLFTFSVFLLIIASVALSIYVITLRGLIFIDAEGSIQEALHFYMVQLLGLIIFALSYGNSILVIAASFARKTDRWIVATPSFSILALIQLFKLLISSLWIFLAIITPVLLAIGNFNGLSWFDFFLSFVLMKLIIIFGIISGVLAYLLSIYTLKIISYIIKRNIVTQSLAILLLIVDSIFVIILLWRIAIPKDFVRFFDGTDIVQLNTIKDQLLYLPTFGISQILHNILFAGNTFGTGYVVMFAIGAVTLLIILYVLLKIQYLKIWQLLQEGHYVADSKKVTRHHYRPYNFPSPSIIHSIIDKELLLMWRDKKNLLWLLMVITLWVSQTAVSWRVTSNASAYGDSTVIPNFFYAIILAIGLYFISALALRFVFPTFSAERKVAWILGVAPIDIWNIAVGKFLIYSGLFILIGSPLLIINFMILNLAFFPALLYWIVFSLSVILIVLLAVFLSIRYPNRFSSDPDTLSTTLPGLAFTSLSLGGSLIISNIMYLMLSKVDLFVLLVLLITILNALLASLIHSAAQKFEYAGEIIA